MDFSQSLLVLHSVQHDLLVVQNALTGRELKTQGQVHVAAPGLSFLWTSRLSDSLHICIWKDLQPHLDCAGVRWDKPS